MDTFRKWLNKPKADDKSLLARFYHADRSLTAVASELDSFDGRAEPDRCSRLVSRLRQGQDKVLAITNLIMEELLGEDRDARAFRVKFPEEVLQENLAGQLWFGAECLAAGSSIMNREQESKEMRPLAQAVTRSLGNVRSLLRDQCLRNNVPNSKTLHLDFNDSGTEQLYESLKIFDRLFAEFELRYVSAMVPVKTKQEYEMQELICVLFSETLQRALKVDLLDQDKVDTFDPALMFSIPRLAIIAGLVVYPKGPLDMDTSAEELSEMFRPFRTILIKIRELLRTLDEAKLYQLEKLLCTNEDIHTTVPVGTSSIEAPISAVETVSHVSNTATQQAVSVEKLPTASVAETTIVEHADDESSISSLSRDSSARSTPFVSPSNSPTPLQRPSSTVAKTAFDSSISSLSRDSSARSTPTVSPTNSPTPSHSVASTSTAASASAADWTDDENDEADEESDNADEDAADDDDDDENAGSPKELDILSADCASGYLIPNTNFGNLLQPQQVPLTDNFIASDDELSNQQSPSYADTDVDLPTTSAALTRLRVDDTAGEPIEVVAFATWRAQAEQLYTRREPLFTRRETRPASATNRSKSHAECAAQRQLAPHSPQQHKRPHTHRHLHPHRHGHQHHHYEHQDRNHQHHHKRSRNHHSKAPDCIVENCDDAVAASPEAKATSECDNSIATTSTKESAMSRDTSSADSTASSLSDGDPHEVSLALRAAGRMKFKNTETLLHRLFVCIAGVADQLQTNFAADLRQILRSVFLMNMTVTQPEPPLILEKTKDSELFEFIASENDVIQESGGSNQSIYSAEEVNAELDNVFNNSNAGGNRGNGSSSTNSSNSSSNASLRHSTGGGAIDLSAAARTSSSLERSRSLGDQEQNVGISPGSATASNRCNRRLSSYINGRRLSSPTQHNSGSNGGAHYHQRNRNNSVGSNSPSSSSSSASESNSPINERLRQTQVNAINNNNINNNATAGTISTTTATTMGGSAVAPTPLTVSAQLSPPAWVPDEQAPYCYACRATFNAFRRRHHCRNCGRVFCGVCSNTSAPLPNYGLTKAVRVCRNCYGSIIRTISRTTAHAHSNTTIAGSS